MSDRPRLVDIGANLTNKAFRDDLDRVLARADEAGVGAVVITGVSAQASRRAWEIAAERRARGPRLYATAGIHPHNARGLSRDALAELRELLAREEVRAVGECGLDYHRDFSPRPDQLRCFEAQLELACETRKPVFLHERDAHEDFARVLERYRPGLSGGVVHCFTGGREALERYLALDLHVGLTGWICDERRGTHLRALAGVIPAGRLMVETDAPFILPRDLHGSRARSGRNEPAYLPHIARAIARWRGEGEDELARHTTETAARFFGLGGGGRS